MTNNKSLLIDFDSTFIKVETLDILAEIVLKDDPDSINKKKLISDLTKLAMVGEINFQTAMKKRLAILTLNRDNISKVTTKISELISDSFKKNKELIKSMSDNIWIISGGFKDIFEPIILEYNIPSSRVIANSFVYEGNKVIGCDENNDLFNNKGKIIAIKKLAIANKKIIIGDGYTDYEVFAYGKADHFICYTENIVRDKVVKLAEYQANSFDEVLEIINNL